MQQSLAAVAAWHVRRQWLSISTVMAMALIMAWRRLLALLCASAAASGGAALAWRHANQKYNMKYLLIYSHRRNIINGVNNVMKAKKRNEMAKI
jgi:hypothetical protein